MDWGNVPPLAWYYAALSPVLLASAIMLFRAGRTAKPAIGLGLMMLGGAVQGPAGAFVWASTTATQATIWIWLEWMFGLGVWLSGYAWLIGYVPAGWNRWMRRISVKGGLTILSLGTVVLFTNSLIQKSTFVAGPDYPVVVTGEAQTLLDLPMAWPFWALQNVIMLASLAVALGALLRARTPLGRRSAWAYLIGLGTIDLWILWDAMVALQPSIAPAGLTAISGWIAWTLYGIWLPAWVAYGILATRLFDIDLRIKGAISGGTMVAVFVAVFFGVSLFVQEWLTEELGLIGGAIAVALLMLVLSPLRRAAQRVSSALMPGTLDTPAYTTHRKVEVFKEAVRECQAEGDSISSKEQRLLDRLRIELGIDSASASVIQQEIRPNLAA